MTSVLQAQLQALDGSQKQPKRHEKSASLLFSPLEAAELSAEDVHAIGREGWQQLCALDARFEPFGKSLFAMGSTTPAGRDHLMPDVAARLDASLAAFCLLLSDYFLLPPSFKALEFLVHCYRVHRHNVDALLSAALPYHATNEFVRLVQILRLEGGLFEFLVPMQVSGAALPRAVLVQRCLTDRALMGFVCQLGQRAGEGGQSGRAAVALYAAVLCELLAAARVVEERLLAALLPHLLAGLGSRASTDYQAATYMVVVQLASVATLSNELVSVLAIELCRSATPALLPQVAMVLAHLAATQPALAVLPDRAFKHLAKLPALAQALAGLAERGMDAGRLRALVARAVAARVGAHANYARLAMELASCVRLGGDEAEALARAVLYAASAECDGEAGAGDVRDVLLKAASTLDARYPEAVGAAVNAALRDAGSEGPSAGQRARLLRFLDDAFARSLRAPLAGAGTTLALALDAASAGTRQMALERLDAAAAEAAAMGDDEGMALLHAAALRRLADDSPDVAMATLQLRSLIQAPAILLGDALERCFLSALGKTMSMSASKSERAAARGVARKALKTLAGPFLAAHPSQADRVLPLLLSSLVDSTWHNLWTTAHKVACKLDHPLLLGLKQVAAPTSLDAPGATAALSRTAAAALASQATKSSEAATALQRLLLSRQGCTAAVLLVACAAMYGGCQGLALAILQQMVTGEWHCASGLEPVPLETTDGLPPAEWMERVGSRQADVEELRLSATLAALQAGPGEELQRLGLQGLHALFAHLCTAGQQALLSELLCRVKEVASTGVFLSEWFAAPPEPGSTQLALVSLELYMGCLQEQAGAASSLVLARLLCALTRPEASVRVRVLSCCQALGAACKRAWGQDSEALLPAADCAALMKALAQQRVAIEGDSAAIEHLLDATLGADASAAGLGLPANRANSLRRFLLCTLAEPVGEPPSKAALHTLRFLAARVAVSASTPAEVADAAQRGLRGFAVLPTGEAAPLLSEEAAGAAADLVKLCDPGRLAGLLASDNAADAQPALEALWTLLRSAGVQGTGPARLVALQQLTTELYEALDEPWKERAVQVLLMCSRDPDNSCRYAAAASLRVLPIHASTLAHMLAAASSEATDPSPILAKGRRKGKVARQQPQLPTALLAPAEALASAVELLELVLERGYDTEEIQLLVQPVQELLARAVDALDVQTGRAASGEEEEAEASVAAGQLMYLLQLTLSCLSMLASQPMVEPASTATATGRRGKQQQQQQQGAFDLALAVRAAQIVRNDNARDAALELITHIALAAPQAALEHALDIVAVAGKVASLHVEERSAAASMQALAAVVPAWLQSSCSLEELVGTAVTAAARMALHRRAPMLAALTAALPAVDGLATVLLLLLRSATEEQAAAADATVMPWTINAATAVLKQAPRAVQAKAATVLLRQCQDASELSVPVLGLGLIASCLAGGAAAMPVEANEAEGAWSELVQQVLLQIQGWVELQARGTAADARLAKAGVDAAFRLLAALERCLEPATYLGCLHAVVAGSSVDKVQRRALELLAAAVNGVTDEVRAAMTEVALGACDIALELVRSTWQQEGSSSSMPTMQAAIGTLSALATAYGNKHPQRFVAALGQLLEVLRHDDAAVRGSACTAVATMARAVGTHLVPVLPAVLPAILGIAKAAIAAAAAGDKGLDESTALQLSAALAAVAELVDTLGAFLAPHVPALLPILVHPAVLDTSSGLCAESAAHIRQQLSQTMPPRLLLPSLLAHLDAAVAAGAASVCAVLDMLAAALEQMRSAEVATLGDSIFSGLLQVLDLRRVGASGWQSAEFDRAEAAAVSSFVALTLRLSESRFKPLLFRLVDWTQSPPTGADAPPIAAGAVLRGLGLFALVNALAERLRGVFVPYFRHLLDLCIAYLSGISAGEGTKKKRRRKSAGANEAVDSSAEPTPAPEAWRLRLRVLRALQRAMLYDAPPGSDARLLDEACFERLLPALAAQLPEHPPEGEAAHAVEAEATADAALEASLQSLVAEGGDEAAPGTDAFGRAVVACLSQLAVAAGSDAQWKPLNYALLMATRATEPRTRLLALYGVSQLQARLAEEYLVLLPETLPYLAELLEDGEHEVEAGATELLRRLEKLSGESLAEYLKP